MHCGSYIYIYTIYKKFELVVHEFLLGLAHRHTHTTHEHRVHVPHTSEGGAVTTLATHHISTAPTVVLIGGEYKIEYIREGYTLIQTAPHSFGLEVCQVSE